MVKDILTTYKHFCNEILFVIALYEYIQGICKTSIRLVNRDPRLNVHRRVTGHHRLTIFPSNLYHKVHQHLKVSHLDLRCLCPIHWNQVFSREWRCNWGSADRRCSNCIWVINNVIAYKGATYIRGLMVITKGIFLFEHETMISIVYLYVVI